jgi:hypothetical protein
VAVLPISVRRGSLAGWLRQPGDDRFACDLTSTAGCEAPLPPRPKTTAAPTSSCAFQEVI